LYKIQRRKNSGGNGKMSMPKIPNIKPEIEICREDVINLLLASVAFEELGLAHLINAEAEKVQAVLGTLENGDNVKGCPSLHDLLKINKSVQQTMKDIIKKEILLQFKLENVMELDEDCEYDDHCPPSRK
jgi:deoxyxylulose-5-phosphate synthase